MAGCSRQACRPPGDTAQNELLHVEHSAPCLACNRYAANASLHFLLLLTYRPVMALQSPHSPLGCTPLASSTFCRGVLTAPGSTLFKRTPLPTLLPEDWGASHSPRCPCRSHGPSPAPCQKSRQSDSDASKMPRPEAVSPPSATG